MFDAVSVVATMAPAVRRADGLSRRRDGKGGRPSDEAVTVGQARSALDRYAADERYPRRSATTSCGSGCEMDFELR